MKRSVSKSLACLVCTLLLLTLPLSSLAQSPSASWLDEAWATGEPVGMTLTFIPGEALKAIPAVADLLEALSLRLVAQEDNLFSLDLLVSGQEALSFSCRAEENGCYLQSQALGDQILYFSWEDMASQLMPEGEAASPFAQAEPGASSPAQAEVPAPLLELYEALGIDITGPDAVDPNAWMDVYRFLGFGEDIIQLEAELLSKAVVTPGEFTDPSHDPAIVKYETFMTEKEFTAVCQTPFIRYVLSEYITWMDPTLTPQEVSEATQQELDELSAAIENSSFTFTCTSLYARDGLVFQDSPYSLSLTPPDGSQGRVVDMPITYRRLTTGDVRTHSFQTKLSLDHADQWELDATLMEQGEDLTYKVILDDFMDTLVLLEGNIQAAEEAFSLFAAVNGQDAFGLEMTSTHGEAETVQEMKLLVRQDALDSLVNSAVPVSSRQGLGHLLTVHVCSAVLEGKEDPFAAIREARPDTSTQPLTMAEEEQAAFFEKTFQIYFLRATFKFMSLLPSSVMESLLQGLSW